MVSLPLYRAQRRRITAAAEADARRRRLIWNALMTALMTCAFFTAAVALHQEQQIQQQELRR